MDRECDFECGNVNATSRRLGGVAREECVVYGLCVCVCRSRTGGDENPSRGKRRGNQNPRKSLPNNSKKRDNVLHPTQNNKGKYPS